MALNERQALGAGGNERRRGDATSPHIDPSRPGMRSWPWLLIGSDPLLRNAKSYSIYTCVASYLAYASALGADTTILRNPGAQFAAA